MLSLQLLVVLELKKVRLLEHVLELRWHWTRRCLWLEWGCAGLLSRRGACPWTLGLELKLELDGVLQVEQVLLLVLELVFEQLLVHVLQSEQLLEHVL